MANLTCFTGVAAAAGGRVGGVDGEAAEEAEREANARKEQVQIERQDEHWLGQSPGHEE